MLYCEEVTFWRYEAVNKHQTEGSGKTTPPVCRYIYSVYKIPANENGKYTFR